MIEFSTATALSTSAALRPGLVPGGTPDFAIALTASLALGQAPPAPAMAVAVEAVKLPEASADRQAVAETGKDLPEGAPERDEGALADTDCDAIPEDIAAAPFAWFATAPVVAETPMGVPIPRPVRGPEPDGRAGGVLRFPGRALVEAGFMRSGGSASPAAPAAAPVVAAEPAEGDAPVAAVPMPEAHAAPRVAIASVEGRTETPGVGPATRDAEPTRAAERTHVVGSADARAPSPVRPDATTKSLPLVAVMTSSASTPATHADISRLAGTVPVAAAQRPLTVKGTPGIVRTETAPHLAGRAPLRSVLQSGRLPTPATAGPRLDPMVSPSRTRAPQLLHATGALRASTPATRAPTPPVPRPADVSAPAMPATPEVTTPIAIGPAVAAPAPAGAAAPVTPATMAPAATGSAVAEPVVLAPVADRIATVTERPVITAEAGAVTPETAPVRIEVREPVRVASPEGARIRFEAVRIDAPLVNTIAPQQPAPLPALPGQAQPAAIAFASAWAGAQGTLPEPPVQRIRPRDIAQGLSMLAPGPDAIRPHAVAAMAQAQQGQLDMRRDDWMGSMIERIETMRDAGGTQETRLRLSPDSLGTLDVSIRQEGDRVHIRFATDNAQTRALIAEAQPRLAEIAEARGLRLGQASVDTGAQGQGQPQPRAQEPAQTRAPRSAFTATASGETAADQRIA